MKDLEEEVRSMKVVRPSTELDRRIERLLSGPVRRARRMPFMFRNIPLWGCAAACVAALFVGVLCGRATAPTSPRPSGFVSFRYIVDAGNHAGGNPFDWTDQEDHFLESASSEDIRVTVSQGPGAG